MKAQFRNAQIIAYLSIIILLVAYSCQKQSEQTPSVVNDDTEFVEDFPDDDLIDEVEYLADGTMKIDSITGTRSNNIVDSWCDMSLFPFKYTNYFKVGKGANKATLTVHCSKKDSVLVSVESNNTAITCSDFTVIDSVTYSFKAETTSDTFTYKSVKFTFTSSRSVNGTPKLFKKSIKMLGIDAGARMYGTQIWGLARYNYYGSSLPAINHGDVHTLDSTYIPQLGDLLYFGNDQRGVIITTPTVTAATATKSAKYKFKFVQYNAKCKAGKTNKSISKYASTFPESILSVDKSEYATKYYR